MSLAASPPQRWAFLDAFRRGDWLTADRARTYGWLLLALTGGQPVNLFGEWDGDALLALSAWQEQQVWTPGASA